jgi:hypothetical protein
MVMAYSYKQMSNVKAQMPNSEIKVKAEVEVKLGKLKF